MQKSKRQNPATSLPPALLPAGGGVGGRVLRGEAGNQNTGEHLWHLSWETGRVCSSVKAAEEDEAVLGEKAAPPVGLILWLSQRPRRRGSVSSAGMRSRPGEMALHLLLLCSDGPFRMLGLTGERKWFPVSQGGSE